MAKDKIGPAEIHEIIYRTTVQDAPDPMAALGGALAELGVALDLGRCLVLESDAGGDRWSVTNEWRVPGVASVGKKLGGAQLHEELPDLMRELSEDGVFMTGSASELPAGLGDLMDSLGSESAAIFPVENAGGVEGLFVFEGKGPRLWDEADIEALRVFSGVAAELLRIKWLEREVRDAQTRMRHILDEMELIIHVKDIESGEILLQNRKLEDLREAGVTDFFASAADRRAENPLASDRREFFVRQTGRFYRKNSAIIPWRGDRLALLEYAEDITDIKNHQDRLERYALLDMFTGTYNRATLLERLGEMLDGAHRQKLPVTVAFVDIDNLRAENDRHGHAAGDELIQYVVGALRQNIRTTDLIGRYGGDEFIVAFYSCPVHIAGSRLDSAREQLDKAYRARRRRRGTVGFSYGLAQSSEVEYEEADSFTEDLIALASQRMQDCRGEKESEKNR